MPYAYNSAEGIDPSPLIRRDRQTREMDTAQEIMGSTGQEEEEHSFQNVGTKSLKKIRKTFSSAIPRDVQSNSSSTSAVVEEENEEQKNSQAEEQGTITKDCNDEGENKELGNNAAQIFSCTSEENGLDEGKSGGGRREKVKKKSWSEIVGSSSSSASSFRENNKDNGTFLQKKGLDQHEDSLVKPNIISHTESTRENDAMHYANTNIYPTEMLLAVQYQLQNHNNRISNSIPSNLDDNLGYDNESKVTILKYPVEDKSSTASAVVESHQQKEIEQGLEAVQGMAGDDNVHQRNKKDANGEEDEQPSCTESFKQLNPFDFTTHVGKGKRERLYKVLVVGELGSGKTSIIKRYVHQFFSQHYRATIGVDFALKVLRWDGDTVVRLQLWDVAGQERFGSMTRVYYKEAVGAFVVFDVTRSATLEAVPKWKADLDSKVALPDGRPIPTVLLANKSDQPKEGIAANREKMNEFCQQQGFSAWFETSAKENINIDESANFLVSKILEMDRWSQEATVPDPDKVDISANGKHKLNSSSNCAC